MRKYFCDRCKAEINFEDIDKYRKSDKYLYDICIDVWSHNENGHYIHSPVELCANCMMKLDDVVAKFMKASCSE